MLFPVTPNITLLPKIKLKSVETATLATVSRPRAGHLRGENSPNSRYVIKELSTVKAAALSAKGE